MNILLVIFHLQFPQMGFSVNVYKPAQEM